MNEDWHATCQAIHESVEGAEREKLYQKCVERNKEVDVRNSSGSSRAKSLCTVRDAKVRGDEYHDQASEQEIVNRQPVRQELWNEHLQKSSTGVGRSAPKSGGTLRRWLVHGRREQNLSVLSN